MKRSVYYFLGKDDKIFAGDIAIDIDCCANGACGTPTLFEGLDTDTQD